MKLAFIVQRYGRDILGGSETLARQLAERLSRRHEITVLTTTAKDYITWKSEYPPGEDKIRGVRVIRFSVEGERNLEEFNKFSEEIYKGGASREQELEWLRKQGPIVPELVDYLKKEHERFEILVFFTYLYYPTYHGLQVAPEKSILVPTAHDEPPLKLGIFREMFQLPSSFLFNSEAEELLVLERFPVHKKMRETIGMGMELLDQPDIHAFRRKHDIPGKYLLYAGRIDPGKGLEELFRFFSFFKEEHPGSGNLQLILIGKLGMKLPADGAIRYIGFVDEGDKLSAMAGAVAVVQPSRMESFSIVTLEAFSVATPVMASAGSRVLLDHCRRSNAGLYYGDFEEFEEVLTLLLSDRNLARSLGRNGQTYVKESYGWNRLLQKYELVFRSSARPGKEPRGARVRTPQAPAPAAAEEGAREQGAPAVSAAETGDDVRTEDLPLLEPSEIDRAEREEEPAFADAESAVAPDESERDERFEEEQEGEPEVTAAWPPEEAPEKEPEGDEPLPQLPSFYRSALPSRPPVPPGPPEELLEEARVDSVPETPAENHAAESEPAEEPREEEEAREEATEEEAREEPTEEEAETSDSGLPEFYRPRPRPAPREETTED